LFEKEYRVIFDEAVELKNRRKLRKIKLHELTLMDDFLPVRSRIKATRQFRSFLSNKAGAFRSLKSFDPIVKEIDHLDRQIADIEFGLKAYAADLLVLDLEDLLERSKDELRFLFEDPSPQHDFLAKNRKPEIYFDLITEIDEVMNVYWRDILAVLDVYIESLGSVSDYEQLGVPRWLEEFRQNEGAILNERARGEAEGKLAKSSAKEAKAYAGDLDVSPSDFILHAERLIFRENEIAFAFGGIDGDSNFTVDAGCLLNNSGTYEAAHAMCHYENPKCKNSVRISITKFSETPSGCDVSGEWHEDGEAWTFSGSLVPWRRRIVLSST
jgi:hypothetical protein